MHLYILCPYTQSEQVKNAHVLCLSIQRWADDRGVASDTVPYLVYVNPPPSAPSLYPNIDAFQTIRRCNVFEIIDVPTNAIILLDYYTEARFRKECGVHHCRMVIWWQSWMNAVFNHTLSNLDAGEDTIHAFHSFAMYATVAPYLTSATPYAFLTTGLVHSPPPEENPSPNPNPRNKVCIHTNDWMAKDCLEREGIPYEEIPRPNDHIVDNESLVISTCQRAGVYLDLRKHSHKSSDLRLACLHGCVIITNRSGVAAYWEDVPIREKVSHLSEVGPMLRRIFAEWEDVYERQSFLRHQVRDEERLVQQNIQTFMDMIRPPIYRQIEFVTHDEYTHQLTTYRYHLDALAQTTNASPLSTFLGNEANHINILTLGKYAPNVLQIGFGDAYTTLLWLLSNGHSRILCFSDALEDSQHARYKYLSDMFPGRLEVLIGPYDVSLRKYRELSDASYPVVHIEKADSTNIATILEHTMAIASDVMYLEVPSIEDDVKRTFKGHASFFEALRLLHHPSQLHCQAYRRKAVPS